MLFGHDIDEAVRAPEELIERALAKDPAERFGSAGEMESALAASLQASATVGYRRWIPWVTAGTLALIAGMIYLPRVLDSGDRARTYAHIEGAQQSPTASLSVNATLFRSHGGAKEALAMERRAFRC